MCSGTRTRSDEIRLLLRQSRTCLKKGAERIWALTERHSPSVMASMKTIMKQARFLFCAVALMGWLSLPGQSAEPPWPFMAYGASATSRELVAVRYSQNDGNLTPGVVQTEPIGCEGAPVLYHEKLRLLYVLSLRAKQDGQNQMVIFSVDDKGRLTRKRQRPIKHGSAYASFDRTGRFLLSVSYFEGHVDVYRLDEDGNPIHVGTTFENRNKAHSVLTAPNNRSVYVPYVKDNNAMFQYRFNPKSGVLQTMDRPEVEVPEGVGPRHVAFHPTRPFVFFSNEQHLGATSYRIATDGRLSLVQVCDAGKAKASKGLAASDIAVTPDGRFLFVAVRDFANDAQHGIHRYEIRNGGRLVHLGQIKADAIPWGLRLSPDGGHLLVSAARGNTLSAYRIGRNGGLEKRSSIKWGNMIRAIAVLPLM